jgi:hypothetical protein
MHVHGTERKIYHHNAFEYAIRGTTGFEKKSNSQYITLFLFYPTKISRTKCRISWGHASSLPLSPHIIQPYHILSIMLTITIPNMNSSSAAPIQLLQPAASIPSVLQVLFRSLWSLRARTTQSAPPRSATAFQPQRRHCWPAHRSPSQSWTQQRNSKR